MEPERTGAIWLASYPKSGNTWLRCLLEAYRRNGLLDPNDIRFGVSDAGSTVMQGVSPMSHVNLGWSGEMLLRPAALLNLFCRLNKPMFIKTHFANIQPDGGLPHCIPAQYTDRAVYVVRDPRSVLLSAMRFFRFPLDQMADAMANKEFRIGGTEMFATTFVSSWSNHVASWTSEQAFPVHIVRYEDLIKDAGKELTEVLEFLDDDVDQDRVRRAVDASDLANLRKREEDEGFRENPSKGQFFGEGGSRWKEELGPKWSERIESDHGDIMRVLGYLDHAKIKAVS